MTTDMNGHSRAADGVAVVFAHGVVGSTRPSKAFVEEHGSAASMQVAIDIGIALARAGTTTGKALGAASQAVMGVVGLTPARAGVASAMALGAAVASVVLPPSFVATACDAVVAMGSLNSSRALDAAGLDMDALKQFSSSASAYGLYSAATKSLPEFDVTTFARKGFEEAGIVASRTMDVLRQASSSAVTALDGVVKVPTSLVAALRDAGSEVVGRMRQSLDAVRARIYGSGSPAAALEA